MRLNLDSPILTALTKVYDSLYATLLFVLGCVSREEIYELTATRKRRRASSI